MMRRIGFLIGLGIALSGGSWVQAKPPQPVRAELIAEPQAIQPGRSFWVALRLVMENGWHTYWVNPGDAGLATAIRWDLPEGFQAGPIHWPYPQRIDTPPLVSFGYEGEVWLLVELESPATLQPGTTVTLSGRADWVGCQEICVKGGADLQSELPVAAVAEPDPRWQQPFAQARRRLPVPVPEWTMKAERNGQRLIVHVEASDPASDVPNSMRFFPEERQVIEYAAPQELTREADGFRLTLIASSLATQQPSRLRGVIVCEFGCLGPESAPAVQVDAPIASQAVAATRSTPPWATGLPVGDVGAVGGVSPQSER